MNTFLTSTVFPSVFAEDWTWDWEPYLQRTPNSKDTQVPYVKWLLTQNPRTPSFLYAVNHQ